ncbi:MAG: hypothetical protein HZB65_02395 [Candidatus Aenigmarchaeota archaeon]|nr:hypothetical protein [Candidatus Aenigmarchaeota archaeon]
MDAPCSQAYAGDFDLSRASFVSNGAVIEVAPDYKGLPKSGQSRLIVYRGPNKWIFYDGTMGSFDGFPDYARIGAKSSEASVVMENDIAVNADGAYKEMAQAITQKYINACVHALKAGAKIELEGNVIHVYDKENSFSVYDKEGDGVTDWFAAYVAGRKNPIVDIRGNDPTSSIDQCNNILKEMNFFLEKNKIPRKKFSANR